MKAGLDDCGSGAFNGFACVMMGDAGAAELELRGRAILAKHSLAEFHGREFAPQTETPAYEQFATAIVETLLGSGEYAAFQLVHRDVFRELFVDFAGRVADGVLARVHGDTLEFVRNKAGALFFAARHLGELTQRTNESVSIEMDQSQPGDEAEGQTRVALSGQTAALITTNANALILLGNAYKEQKFPKGPRFGSFRVTDSRNSILVQAADVLANFGVAFVKSRLRTPSSPSSGRELEKARIFNVMVPAGPIETGSLSVTKENVLAGSMDDHIMLQLTAFKE